VTAALLRANGVAVFAESEIGSLERAIQAEG